MSDERTSRPPSDAALLGDAEFTRALLANSSDAIEVLDLAGRITFISDGALRALAIRDADGRIGAAWAASWQDAAQASDAIARAKAGAATALEGERRGGDGKPRWWEATVSPILDG